MQFIGLSARGTHFLAKGDNALRPAGPPYSRIKARTDVGLNVTNESVHGP